MTTATFAAPAPLLDPALVEGVVRAARLGGRVLAFAAQSVGAAAFVWALLAGPGFLG